jgi:CheY-like chemotaxis protein
MLVDIDMSQVTVLIVDDSRYARSFLKSSLQAFGIRSILEAGDGPTGIELLKDNPVTLALVDHDMAPMDGIEFTRFVRRGGLLTCSDVAIVMVSAASEMETVITARNAGINEYLVKPVSADALFRRLRSVLVNPRPFVKSGAYVGPCRRIADRGAPSGAERRKAPPLPRPDPLIKLPPGFKQAQRPGLAQPSAAPRPAGPAQGDERTGRKRFKAGQVIFEEGARGEEAYVVESGRVAIYKTAEGRKMVLGELSHGGVFGEMALIDDEPRMASAEAVEDTSCLVLPKAALKLQVAKAPDLVILVLETLLDYIRTMGRDLVHVRAALEQKRK